MPISAEDFHQAWVNQVMRAERAEIDLKQAQKRIAELEAENTKIKEAVEKSLRKAEEKARSENVPAEA